jgi:hypothetical protein
MPRRNLQDFVARRPLTPYINEPPRHTLSLFTFECEFCGAVHFLEERISSSTITHPIFSNCCQKGKVVLIHRDDPPQPLRSLFTQPDHPGMLHTVFLHILNTLLILQL